MEKGGKLELYSMILILSDGSTNFNSLIPYWKLLEFRLTFWGRESNVFGSDCCKEMLISASSFTISQQMVTKASSNAEFHGSIRWINSETSRT